MHLLLQGALNLRHLKSLFYPFWLKLITWKLFSCSSEFACEEYCLISVWMIPLKPDVEFQQLTEAGADPGRKKGKSWNLGYFPRDKKNNVDGQNNRRADWRNKDAPECVAPRFSKRTCESERGVNKLSLPSNTRFKKRKVCQKFRFFNYAASNMRALLPRLIKMHRF